MINYDKLYKKYLYKKDQLVFDKERVVEIITSKFSAREFSKTQVLDLVNDDQLEYNKIFGCFVVDDPNVLNRLFTTEERTDFRDQVLDNRRNLLNTSNIKKNEWNYNDLLLDEQEGRRIDIFLESKDGKYISNFILRSYVSTLGQYLNALVMGALIQNDLVEFEVNVNDEYFQFYLENLDKFGFLN